MRSVHKAAAMGNWWLAASSQECILVCITSHTEFFRETSNHLGDLAPLQPRFGALWLMAFPKTKITFKREDTSDVQKTQENVLGQWMVIGTTVWGSKVPTLKGTEASLSYVQYFLYLVSSLINVSIFHSTWMDTFWTHSYHRKRYTHVPHSPA